MAFKLFKNLTNATVSDKLKLKKDRHNLVVGRTVDVSNNPCYKPIICNSKQISNYNTLKKYTTFYNNPQYDFSSNKIINFNGNIDQANYLNVEIDLSANLVKPLQNINDYSNNTINNFVYNNIANSNRLYIDLSGIIFSNNCNNLYYKNTLSQPGIRYYIDNSNNSLVEDIDNIIKLCNINK